MRRALLAIFCVSLALAGTAEARSGGASHAHAPHTVVVELFTSQALAASVPAERLVGQLADDPGVLVLTFPVDYWDYTGWNDTFAKPEFTTRQKAYEKKLALNDLYTPQIIVDGSGQVSGTATKDVESLIRKAQKQRTAGPRLRFARHGRLVIDAGRRHPAGGEVWLVRYDPTVRQVSVKRGENRGQIVHERNVVRQLARLGTWAGRQKSYVVPDGADAAGLKTAVLLQAAKGGRVLAVLQR